MAEASNKGLSRRQFLTAIGIGTATAVVEGTGLVLLSGTIEKKAIGVFMDSFSNPDNTNGLLNSAVNIVKVERENLAYRPMHTLVSEGIENYEQKSGKKATYVKSSAYRNYEFYKKIIDASSKKIDIVANNPSFIVNDLTDSFPPDAKIAYYASVSSTNNYFRVLPRTSGMYQRLSDAGKGLISQEIIDRVTNETKGMIVEAKNYMESVVEKNGNKPISASNVLTFFLGKNEGKLRESLDDTWAFLRFMSRNNIDDGTYIGEDPGRRTENIRWMQENVLDEYGFNNYQDAPISDKDNYAINQIGKAYHSWNLVAMLPYFPVTIVQIAGGYDQIKNISQQGVEKLGSDLTTLSDLKQTEDVLLKYA